MRHFDLKTKPLVYDRRVFITHVFMRMCDSDARNPPPPDPRQEIKVQSSMIDKVILIF